MDKITEKYNSIRQIQDEIEYLNSPIPIKESEFVIINKTPGLANFTRGCYQTFKK